MRRRLIQSEDNAGISPLIDVVMNGLAAVFILLMVYMIVVRPEDSIDLVIDKGQGEVSHALNLAMAEYAVTSVNHRVDGHRQRITFASDVLFRPASYELDQKGMHVLRAISAVLVEFQGRIYNSDTEAGYFSTIQIDGHTDSTPIRTSAIPSNWHLSSLRAISVLQFLVEMDVDPRIMSPTGYADTRPVDRNNSFANVNRRVEITLVYSPSDIRAAVFRFKGGRQ